MNAWDDKPHGSDHEGHGPVFVRDLLEDASWPGREITVEPHESWAHGRRRRNRRRAGAGAVAAAAVLAVGGLVWQAGVFGGTTGEREPHVATVPSGLTTFVLAAPGAPDVDPSTISALHAPTEEELNGSSWTLTGQIFGSEREARDVVGSGARTVFSFGDPAADRGWGFLADDCGGGWFQEGLSLTSEGAFDAGGSLATDDQGCLEPAQVAEDFWLEVLPDGGTLHLLGGHWLLLSVDVGQNEAAAPSVVETTTGPETGSAAPSADPTDDPPRPVAPTEDPSTAEPPATGSATPQPTPPDPTAPTTPATPAAPPTVPEQPTTPEAGDVLAGFTTPDVVVTSEGWPGSGGDLLAPTVRAGLNDGFDRVVLDLTGTTTPTWLARYTDAPVRDGSGLPVLIAGDSVLELVVTGMAYPEPGDPVYDDGDFGLDTHRLDGVYEVIRTTPFEGQLQLFVGLQDGPRPYRVFLLQDPLRLVVDVQRAG